MAMETAQFHILGVVLTMMTTKFGCPVTKDDELESLDDELTFCPMAAANYRNQQIGNSRVHSSCIAYRPLILTVGSFI
jgi:hypothetical protein